MYAEEKLKIAMIELMEMDSFEKITVTNLCKQSNVSRPTFYHHFSSLANLAFEAILYQTKNEIPHLQNWEDWLDNISLVLNNVKAHFELFKNFGHVGIHEEAAAYLGQLIKKTIKRQETLLNYHLSPINEGFITRLYAETYLAFLIEYIASNMEVDPSIISSQCHALLGDAINSSLRGFMRIEQQS